MILGFKEKFPWGANTYFKNKIWASIEKTNFPSITPKLHSIREGDRWKAGMKIHMAYGVRTKNYNQFNKGIPELEYCKSVQEISISPGGLIMIDGKGLNEYTKSLLAANDGFDSLEDFMKWFKKGLHKGQIIHWTDYKY